MRGGSGRPAGARRLRWTWAVAAAGLAAWAGPAGAQILKLGYVDSVRIFDAYTLAKDSQQRFAREIEAWRVDSDERRKALEQLRAEAHEQSLGLSEEKRVEKEAELEKAQADYDQFVQAFWGPNGKAAQLNQQLTQEIIQKVRDVVERIAHDEAYDLILDAADGNVIFAVKSLDLTDRVIEILNKEAGTPTTGGQP
jgi:Skp family chaperone for outer membrane proteins